MRQTIATVLLRELLTVDELATRFGVKPVTVRAWIAKGRIKGINRNGVWLFDRLDFTTTENDPADNVKPYTEQELKTQVLHLRGLRGVNFQKLLG